MLISETSEPIAQSADPVDRVSSSPVHVRNIAFTLLAIAIVILLLQYMQPVLLPLVLGALPFYALDPAVDWLQRLRVPRAVGAALNPPAPEPRFNLALDLERTGQIDEALTEYRADLHLRPADARAQNQLGIALSKQGRLADAVGEYQEALRLDPDFTDVHRHLGTTFLQQQTRGFS